MSLGNLGKYERLDVLGHGASGIVYLAKDTLLGRQVALKEISAQGEDATRFLEEARVLDRLRHPNIVQVNSVDQYDGKIVIDMEYVRGRNLQDILRKTPLLPVADSVRIATQICEALAYAHGQHVVHRDIKPANIILTDREIVKLVDFGLAEVLGTHSFAGGGGTYAYMAPEDFNAEGKSGRQSDIWAAGVVLFEILAGYRPFRVAAARDPFAWKRAVDEDLVPNIALLRPGVPVEIGRIIARALARDRAARYQDAADMARDLAALGLGASRFGVPAEFSDRSGESDESGESEISDESGGSGLLDRSAIFTNPAALPGFPTASDIDDFLALAPDQWTDACAVLTDGSLSRWLVGIGEKPLAEAASEISAEPDRDDSEKLRDFLYRAGLETESQARQAYEKGARQLRSGHYDEAATLLRRATRLNPGLADTFTLLAQALRAQGDADAASLAVEEGLAYHPGRRSLAHERAVLSNTEVELSSGTLDYGILRQGQTRSHKLTVRNAGKGEMRGRVASAPGWISVEPDSFTVRNRQTLVVTANTGGIWQVPAAYHETLVLETSGGRHEITVDVNVLPARRTFAQVALWYLPVLVCCLLPALAGALAAATGRQPGARDLWETGFIASGLLGGSLFATAGAADTVWSLRLIPLAIALLGGFALTAYAGGGSSSGHGTAGTALGATVVPLNLLLVMQAAAMRRDAMRFGRWPIWAGLAGLFGLLASYVLLKMG